MTSLSITMIASTGTLFALAVLLAEMQERALRRRLRPANQTAVARFRVTRRTAA